MSRYSLLLALLSLLFVESYAQLTLNATVPSSGFGAVAGKQWTSVTARATWSPRAGGVVEWYTGSTRVLQGTTVRLVTGPMMLMYGVGVWSTSSAEERHEVWYSTSHGKTWAQVYVEGDGFNPLLSPITVQDSKGWQYRIQGAQAAPPSSGVFGDVYMSSNGGSLWKLQGQLPSDQGRFLGQAVVDSKDTIWVTMGQWGEGGSGALSDVWSSTNQGKSWKQATLARGAAAPIARAVHGSVAMKYRDTDAIYVMYGWERAGGGNLGNVYRNDIWVTTTGGTSWVQIRKNAPWSARGDCQVEVTTTGVIVIAGGISNVGVEKRELNDVWASLDGGYSWGLCTENAEFTDRQFPYTLIDDEGYLYVMGGREEQNGGRQVNDVWKSVFSYNDVNEVAARCNLWVPSCGVGLKCLPDDDDTFMQGEWGVSCAACPYTVSAVPPPAPAAASNTMTILFVVFLLLFVATMAALVYTYYKMRASGVSSPIPLPAGAQRWWNSNTGPQVGGMGEGLNKSTTGSEDTYSQLAIRDQM